MVPREKLPPSKVKNNSTILTLTVRSSLPLTTWSAFNVNTADVTVLMEKEKKKLNRLDPWKVKLMWWIESHGNRLKLKVFVFFE